MVEQVLFKLFEQYQINFELHQHEPVFTVNEGLHLTHSIAGAHGKNFFLRNKKKSYYCLVSVIENKQVDIKSLNDGNFFL
jgi:Ala-tRNA(Pro) deacylase